MINELSTIKKKKKIDAKKFAALAKKVKESFIEEEKYLEKKYGNNPSGRLLIDY